MLSKRVIKRSALAAEVASAAEEWSSVTVETLDHLLAPYLQEGEQLPDTELLQQLLGRLVADRGKRLEASGKALGDGLDWARSLRWKRDEEAEKLRELLRAARFYFDQTRGRGAGAKEGLGHGLSWMAPRYLARLAFVTVLRLEILEPLRPTAAFQTLPDKAELCAAITAQKAVLEDLLAKLGPRRANTDFARGEQIKGLRDTEWVVRRCSGLLGEIYKLCGHPGLAKKIRPTFRRKPRARKAVAPVAPEAPAVTEPPADSQPPVAAAPEPGWLDDLDWSEVRPAAERAAPRGKKVRGLWGIGRPPRQSS